jgi:hypothetical protein
MTGRAAAYTDEGRESQLSPDKSPLLATKLRKLAIAVNDCAEWPIFSTRSLCFNSATETRVFPGIESPSRKIIRSNDLSQVIFYTPRPKHPKLNVNCFSPI